MARGRVLATVIAVIGLAAVGAAGFLVQGAPRKAELGPGRPPRAPPAPQAELPPAASSAATPPVVSEPRAKTVTVIAGGDVNLGRRTGQRLLADASYNPLTRLETLWSSADLRFVNLESQLSDQGGVTQDPRRRLVFTGPPEGARALAQARIDLVSMANNHAYDYGHSAFLETLQHLDDAGVRYVGATRTPGQAEEPAVLHVRGWSIAWFAVTDVWNHGAQGIPRARPYVAFAHPERVAERVRRARAQHDLVLVSYHGGKEYSENVSFEAQRFARAVMAAGADAMIGHHPHVPQGVEWFDGRPALYSLGNLVFNQNPDHPWTGRGFLARLTFGPVPAAPELELCPYRIVDTVPEPISPAEVAGYRQYLLRVNSVAGLTDTGVAGARGCLPLSPRSKMLGNRTSKLVLR